MRPEESMGEGSLRSEAFGRQQGKPEIYQQPGGHDGAEDEIECHGGSLETGWNVGSDRNRWRQSRSSAPVSRSQATKKARIVIRNRMSIIGAKLRKVQMMAS